MVRVYYWIPKSLFGWSCALIAGVAIGIGLLFLLVGPNWASAEYTTTGSRDALVIALLAGVAGGTYLGATLERPRILRALASKELISSYLARNASLDKRFGPNTQEVDELLGWLRKESLATWDALAAAHEAALATPWAAQSSEIIRNIMRFGLQVGELEARQTYLRRASAEAIEVALAASFQSPGGPPTAESIVQARIDAGVAMAIAVAARPYLREPSLATLWKPFERQLPLAERPATLPATT